MKFECSECGQPLEVETVYAGQEVECPSCGKTVVIPGVRDQESGASGEEPGMSVGTGVRSQGAGGLRTMVRSLWERTIREGDRPEMTLKGETMRGRGAGANEERLSNAIKVRPKDISEKGSTVEVPEYEILRLLGEGGMGMVYEARQTSIDRSIAIKMIKPDAAKDKDECHQFLAEAVATADLDHPNIVPIHDLGMNREGALFYAMKEVKGTSWKDLLPQKSVDENLDILMRVADAVAFAHNRGVIHRDLKPENVMLGDFGEVLLMDWGMAAAVTAEAKADKLDPNHAIGGTPCYMAPEMAVGDAGKIGYASDIYLLGAILFEIVTGEQPHTGTDVMDCLANAAENVIVETEAEGELLDIALKAMATEPEERFETVKAFQTAVRAYQQHEESIALSTRARQGLVTAKAKKDYRGFAHCVFQLEEALSLWPENGAAAEGLSAGRREYAECALQKGDLDLATSILDGGDPAHRALSKRIHLAQKERTARQKRAKALKATAIASAAAAAVVFAVAFFFVQAGRRRAVRAEREAVAQRDIAQQALAAESEAKQEATRQRDTAEDARKAADAARANEEDQRRIAEVEGYWAKIGMAAAKIKDGDTQAAESILDSAPAYLRHWEWGRLKFRCKVHLLSFEGHERHVGGIAVSPDGGWLATASWDGTAKIWDPATGRHIRTFKGHRDRVVDVAWSPDGKQLATASWDGTARIWDAASGSSIRTFEDHGSSPDGGKGTTEMREHGERVSSVSWSPDGQRLATSGWNGEAKVWDVHTGQEQLVLRSSRELSAAAFSPDGKKLVTASNDRTARIWDAWTGKELVALNGHESWVGTAIFSPNGKFVATGTDPNARIWDAESGRELLVLKGHTRGVCAVAFSPDGSRLLTGSDDYTAKIWDVGSGENLMTIKGQGNTVAAVTFLSGGRRLVTGGGKGIVKVWDALADSDVKTLEGHDSGLDSVAFSPDGKRLLTTSGDHTARVWDVGTGKTVFVLAGHGNWVCSGAFSPDGRRIATGSTLTRLWDAGTGKPIRTFGGDVHRTVALAFSPDGKTVASGGGDNIVRVWDVESARLITEFRGHKDKMCCAAFSPDGKRLATGGYDRDLRVWDPATGKVFMTLKGHRNTIASVRYSSDGKRLVTGSWDNTAKMWDATTGRQLATYEGHIYRVSDVAISKDGRRVATASWDSTVKIWEADSGQEILTLKGHTGGVQGIALSPDGLSIATASGDKTARIWPAVPWVVK